jgi:hypothetical protein
MNKLILLTLFALVFIVAARRIPRKHSDFFGDNSDSFIEGYFLDWGDGPFNPIVSTDGLARLGNLDLLYYSFITLTYDVNIVWGGTGY